MDRLNNLSVPAAILLGALILGGFYYLTQASKQGAIERQQQAEMQARKSEKADKASCVIEAETAATKQYEESCTYDCKEGYFYTRNYDDYYKSCLQRKGLE